MPYYYKKKNDKKIKKNNKYRAYLFAKNRKYKRYRKKVETVLGGWKRGALPNRAKNTIRKFASLAPIKYNAPRRYFRNLKIQVSPRRKYKHSSTLKTIPKVKRSTRLAAAASRLARRYRTNKRRRIIRKSISRPNYLKGKGIKRYDLAVSGRSKYEDTSVYRKPGFWGNYLTIGTKYQAGSARRKYLARLQRNKMINNIYKNF